MELRFKEMRFFIGVNYYNFRKINIVLSFLFLCIFDYLSYVYKMKLNGEYMVIAEQMVNMGILGIFKICLVLFFICVQVYIKCFIVLRGEVFVGVGKVYFVVDIEN